MNKKTIIDSAGLSVAFVSSLPSCTEKEISICDDRYEIIYVVSGGGKFIVEGEESLLSAGYLYLIAPLEYSAVILDERSDFNGYVICFNKSELSDDAVNILDSTLRLGSCGGRCQTAEEEAEQICSVFERFAVAERLGGTEKRTFCLGLLCELLALLSVGGVESLRDNEDTLFARVTGFINANIQKELSLDILSHRFFVSKYYLCRVFKQQSGTSIHNYINQKRVLHAKKLIESGETASRAAERVGFGDYSAFYRAYTKFQGASPVSVKQKGDNR